MPTLMPKDYKINPTNGHKYFLTTRVAWKDAQQQALAAGGNLVTINDAQEQKWLVDQFGNKEQFWIGLHRNAGNGNFEWMSGQPVKYQNWDTGAPDNVQIIPKGEVRPIGEDFVVMNFNQDGSGKWNDLCSCQGTFDNGNKHNSSSYRGIVEIEDQEQEKKLTLSLFKEDFEGNLEINNECDPKDSALTAGRTARGLKVTYHNKPWGCRSFQLLGVFEAGKTYQASVWCKANREARCMLFFGDDKKDDTEAYEHKDRAEREGNGEWQQLTTRPIKMRHDERMSVYVYSPVTGTSVTYDDILVEEVVNQ